MTNNLKRPEDIFVRCSWHTPRGTIVQRENGKEATGRLRDVLEKMLPMTYGICKTCAVQIEAEEMGRCFNGR